MYKSMRLTPLAALLLLGGCMTIPIGPSVTVMPGRGKNFDQFRHDDANATNSRWARSAVLPLTRRLSMPA